jgi:selenide,water dikinase
VLVLSKPLGTGAITTAAKNLSCPEDVLSRAVDSMKRLNRDALRALARHGVRACTDVTGFSFAGHALEMAGKSGVGLLVYAKALPYLEGAAVLAAAGNLPGGAKRNRKYYSADIEFETGLDEAFRGLYFIPETSGGLLAAIPSGEAEACLADLLSSGHQASIVGTVICRGASSAMRVVDSRS